MKKLPIGIQTFEPIINSGYLYIDKTEAYHHAFNDGNYFFLSRPCSFGKSLMISTLKALYQGKRGSMTDKYYILGYPNQEVRQSFIAYLLAEYLRKTPTYVSSGIIVKIRAALRERNWEGFFEVINRVFASVAYHIFQSNEAYCHSLVHLNFYAHRPFGFIGASYQQGTH